MDRQNFSKKILLSFNYFWEYMKEFYQYQYILEGELPGSGSEQTKLMYRKRGKRDIFTLSAQDICNNPHLISKFHPLDVRIISYISAIEQILEISPEQRQERFDFIKSKIFKSL